MSRVQSCSLRSPLQCLWCVARTSYALCTRANGARSQLPIGEDLGVVPNRVRELMHELGICGTKVMRWERNWDLQDQPFVSYSDYPIDSLACVSTHDTETLGQYAPRSLTLIPDLCLRAILTCSLQVVGATCR